MKSFPLNTLSLQDVAERELLVAKLRACRLNWFGSEMARLNALIARTPSGCMNYPRVVRAEPESAA